MHTKTQLHEALSHLEKRTGIVLPIHFPQDMHPDTGMEIVQETVHMFVREIDDPRMICLSVDGPGPAVGIARRLASFYHTRITVSDRNRGKLAAVQNGMRELLTLPELRYLATVDQDGDHFANELLNFMRAAEQVLHTVSTDRVLVLGERVSRHRPLGFLRAEQEELANRILMDALLYDAALCDTPLSLTFSSAGGEIPDFHSGYKLFSRSTAEAVFGKEPDLAGCSEDACYRHACEAVMTVEAIKHGAILATVNRRTFDEQPVSNFANLNRALLAADMIIWPCKRLDVPGPFVSQWLDNHLPKLQLGSLLPLGRDELLSVRALVLEAFDCSSPADRATEIARPRFV